jgi:uncharacterized membrane protein YqaE (UPF0057 family)
MKRQILIEFQDNKFFLDLVTSQIVNDNKISDINKFCLTSIQSQLKSRYGLRKEDYYLSTRTKLVGSDWDFINSDESYYIVNLKVKGGMLDLLKKLVSAIGKIAKLVTKIPNFVKWLVDMFIWVITEVLNPLKFFQDLARAIITVIKTLIMAIFDLFSGAAKYVVNGIFTPVVSGFWGYTPAREQNTFCIISEAKKNSNFVIVKKSKNKFDKIFPVGSKVIIQSNKDSKYQFVTVVSSQIDTGNNDTGTTKVTINTRLNDKYPSGSTMAIPGKYGTGLNKGNCGKQKCISISNSLKDIKTDIIGDGVGDGIGSKLGISLSLPEQQGKLPISIIITTIFLPPLGLFMELGFKGWLNIAICALLTLFFYFPGLIYALIILYC